MSWVHQPLSLLGTLSPNLLEVNVLEGASYSPRDEVIPKEPLQASKKTEVEFLHMQLKQILEMAFGWAALINKV